MFLKMLLSRILARFLNLQNFTNFCIFLSFSEFEGHFWPAKFFISCRLVTWQNSRDKKWFWTFFTAKSGKFFKFWTFQFFFYLITNKARKLKLQSRISSWKIFLALSLSLFLSLCHLGFFSVSFSFTFYLSHSLFLSLSLSLSFLNSFVDAAHQLKLCGVMSSSITLNF